MPDDDDIDEVVPAGFAVVVERREPPGDARPYTLEAMKGEDVVVRANGFTYRGRLIGADESDLYLRGEMRWIVLPLSSVTRVALEDKRPRHLGLPPDLEAGEE